MSDKVTLTRVKTAQDASVRMGSRERERVVPSSEMNQELLLSLEEKKGMPQPIRSRIVVEGGQGQRRMKTTDYGLSPRNMQQEGRQFRQP
jgi:hypothetical protein